MSLPMIKVRSWGLRLIIFSIILSTIYTLKLWQPRRQIELHQKNFLLALEDRRWSRAKSFLAEDYADRFGYNRESVIVDLREVLRQFFAVTIRSQGERLVFGPESATVTANITLSGTGTAATEFIVNEANKLVSPWIFTWRKKSFWPWDWQLERVDNASLDVSSRGRGNF